MPEDARRARPTHRVCAWCGGHDARPELECERCCALRCEPCATKCPGCRVLGALRALMSGADDGWDDPRDPAGHGARKTAYLVRTLGNGRDVLLEPRTIWVRALGDANPHPYFASAAPDVLRDWMRATGVTRIDRPLVAHARPTHAWPQLRGSGHTKDELVWLLPSERGLEARFRTIPPSVAPPEVPIEIPASGPLALPEPWAPPPMRPPGWATFAEPGVKCPHCSAQHVRLRRVGESAALVCPACGRSFERGEQR